MSFLRVEEAVLLEEHPCDCVNDGHSLALGILVFTNGGWFNAEEPEECRQCGAVWLAGDRTGDWTGA